MRCTDIGKQAFVILRQNVQKCLFLKNLHSPSAGTNAPLIPQLFQLPYAHFSPFSSTSDPHVVQKTIALSGQRSEPDQNKGVSSVVFHQTCLSPPFVKCQSAERDVRTMIQFFVLYQIRFRFVIVFRASCIWFFSIYGHNFHEQFSSSKTDNDQGSICGLESQMDGESNSNEPAEYLQPSESQSSGGYF